jgi:hypothetical protein
LNSLDEHGSPGRSFQLPGFPASRRMCAILFRQAATTTAFLAGRPGDKITSERGVILISSLGPCHGLHCQFHRSPREVFAVPFPGRHLFTFATVSRRSIESVAACRQKLGTPIDRYFVRSTIEDTTKMGVITYHCQRRGERGFVNTKYRIIKSFSWTVTVLRYARCKTR